MRSGCRCARPLRLWGRRPGLGFGCRRIEQPSRELRIQPADHPAPELRRLDTTAERWRLDAATTAAVPTTPPVTGSAKLTWTAPTTNSNGSALTGLAGYHVHYGSSAGSLTNTIDIANPATLTYVVTDLTAGTWYFAITAYTNSGTESAQSNVGKKTIT